MRKLFGAVAVLAGLLATQAAAQEAVTHKRYAAKAGDKLKVTKSEDSVTVTTINAKGQEQKKDEKRTKAVVYVTEVLEVGADATKPAKLRRAYEQAVATKDGAESKLPLDGKTVVIEKKGDKYTFTLADGTALEAKAAAELDREFNKKGDFGEELFPDGPVKPGGTWDLTEKFLKMMDDGENPFVIDAKKAKVTGKLISTVKKDGATFGDISIVAALPLTDLRGKVPLKLKEGSNWVIEMKGSGCFDGTRPEGGTTGTMKFAIESSIMGIDLKVNTVMKMSSRTERATGGKR